ncbi:MFS transporter [Sedimentitalea sp.]|uniref:MFS transporter n=1 Tax=Sedimentitalea sp. TaxID=2048915 RepID=UPI003299BD19
MAEPIGDTGTQWRVVFVGTIGGAAAAMQVGKAGSTLPLIRSEFGADISLLAIYISIVSLLAAAAGMGFGLATRKIGLRRSASAGLILIALASLLGAGAQGAALLLFGRVIEAFGFALCTSALPALVRSGAAPQQQSLVMGIWASWMPVGVAMAMAASAALLNQIGWRGIFVVSALVPLLALAALWVTVPKPPSAKPLPFSGYKSILRPDVVILALVFVAFSAANMIYMGFLPTILVDVLAMSPARANLVVFLAVLFLVPTNLLGGRWLDRGVSAQLLLVSSFALMAVSPVAIMLPDLPEWARLCGIVVFAAAAGVPPAVIWGAIPKLGRAPGDAPILSGIFYQGAGIGQIAGPIAAGMIYAAMQNWWSAIWAMAAFSLFGALLGFFVRLTRPAISRKIGNPG